MEKAWLKLERRRLDKNRLEKLRQYEAHYMEICQYCADKLEMLGKWTKIRDKSPEPTGMQRTPASFA